MSNEDSLEYDSKADLYRAKHPEEEVGEPVEVALANRESSIKYWDGVSKANAILAEAFSKSHSAASSRTNELRRDEFRKGWEAAKVYYEVAGE